METAEPVTQLCIEEQLVALGLKGTVVEVHSSLSSFGYVIGGAESVVNALLSVCNTVLMPAYNLPNIRPPETDRPEQNGIQYDANARRLPNWRQKLLARMGFHFPTMLSSASRQQLKACVRLIKTAAKSNPITARLFKRVTRIQAMQSIKQLTVAPFDPNLFGNDSSIDIDMGIIPRTLLRMPGTVRSRHPAVSWAANGPQTEYYINPHPPDDPLLPLRKLYQTNGFVLLLGVSLAKCTALHLSEQIIGRRPFIRWVLYSDGVIRRVRHNGCIGGAINFEPAFERFATRVKIGSCEAVAYSIRAMVDTGAAIIRTSPHITLCANGKGCVECIDAAKGGPIV
jgi:aminoglycoside N3'-acetyltransferase